MVINSIFSIILSDAAADAASENTENAAAKADPNSEHYIPPNQEPADPK